MNGWTDCFGDCILRIEQADPAESPQLRGLSKSVAEDVLDWLEAHQRQGVVSYEEGRGFSITVLPSSPGRDTRSGKGSGKSNP
jgi:hypothetical protein